MAFSKKTFHVLITLLCSETIKPCNIVKIVAVSISDAPIWHWLIIGA